MQKETIINWEAIGAMGEIFGALVVVATIFYLAVQIRQNHRSNMMVAAGRTGESTDAWLRQLVQDAELNNIYQQGLRDYAILNLAEKSRFDMLILQFLKAIETAWAQQDLGVLNDDQWYGYEASIRQVVGSPGGLIVLGKRKDAFSPNFIEMVQQVLAGGEN